ncbi:MAG TPA: GtrA family protein [Bacillota bacterium]|nr:GtrA family protein [Bacillota bacterium]
MITENLTQLFKFAAVGCVNTFIDWAVYFTIIKILPSESIFLYTAAKGFSYFCGIVNSFLLNRCWTFKAYTAEHEGYRFAKFALVSVAGIGLNSISIFLFLSMGLVQIVSLFLATFVAFSFNFTLSKVWVFRKGKMVAKTSGG